MFDNNIGFSLVEIMLIQCISILFWAILNLLLDYFLDDNNKHTSFTINLQLKFYNLISYLKHLIGYSSSNIDEEYQAISLNSDDRSYLNHESPNDVQKDIMNNKCFVEVKNIFKSFKGKNVLNNVSLKMYENEILVLLGKNGEGKSTLINILIGRLKRDSGEVALFDRSNNIK